MAQMALGPAWSEGRHPTPRRRKLQASYPLPAQGLGQAAQSSAVTQAWAEAQEEGGY